METKLIDGTNPMVSADLFAMLERAEIGYSTTHHKPLRTVAEAKTVRPATNYGHTKNLFLRDRKGKLILLSLHEDRKINLKETAKLLGSKNLSFASPERLMQYLGVAPGAVSPFALINDKNMHVQFFIDETLMQDPELHIHPLDNTMTTTLSTNELLAFLGANGHEYEVLVFPK